MFAPETEAEREILRLEEAAFHAWPAAEVRELDGFRLRATGGVTRRANSVWTAVAVTGATPLDQRITLAEAFYAERGIACRFQLCPSSDPELEPALVQRGYVLDAPVSVQVARVEGVLAGPPDARARVEHTLTEAWFDVSARKGRFQGVEAVYRGLLERIGSRARFAIAEVEGVPSAVGLGVCQGEWFGIFSMFTLEGARRRKLGSGIVGALARAAVEAGATRLYLQVERDNRPAEALYAAHGFSERYGYHYRLRPGPGVVE